MWEIEFFTLPSGRCPVNDFFDTLDKKKDIPYIMHEIDLLEELGYELRRPHAAPLKDKIYELRPQTETGNYRFFYFFFDKNKIIFTHGFKKKKGPVGNHQLELAKKYRLSYLEREKNETK
jgi:phage-related protein